MTSGSDEVDAGGVDGQGRVDPVEGAPVAHAGPCPRRPPRPACRGRRAGPRPRPTTVAAASAAPSPAAAMMLWPHPWPMPGRASYSHSTATRGPSPPSPRRPAHEGGLQPVGAPLDVEALRLEGGGQQVGGEALLEQQLGPLVDPVRDLDEQRRPARRPPRRPAAGPRRGRARPGRSRPGYDPPRPATVPASPVGAVAARRTGQAGRRPTGRNTAAARGRPSLTRRDSGGEAPRRL